MMRKIDTGISIHAWPLIYAFIFLVQALQVPTDKYSVADSDGTKVACDGKDIVAVRSKTTGPLDFLSLGSLPVNNFQKIRPANCITRPNHILWTLKSGAEVKLWFKENFPRLDFDDLISDKEWERFAKAEGLAFPRGTQFQQCILETENEYQRQFSP